MTLSDTGIAVPAPPAPAPRPVSALRRRRPEVLTAAAIALVALALAGICHAHRLTAVPDLARGTLASLILFGVCGDALAVALLPRGWRALRPLIALAVGAAASALALTAFGVAHVPLRVSLWLVLAGGLAASVLVRRRCLDRALRTELLTWLAVAFVLFCVALIPAWRTGLDTIYGVNPDAHQVAGIAVLFQHVPPTATDNALPIDTVPPSWRFRYPIFYGLAAAGNLAHQDPILVFPAMAALLLMLACIGFGALAVRCLRLPPAGGMVVAAGLGIWVIALHLAWHPYWNQLWGLAMLPYALLFGWRAIADADGRLAILLALVLVTLGLGYPLALPYPLVILLAVLVGCWRRPRIPTALRRRAWLAGAIGVVLLLPAVLGAAVKLEQGISQIVTPDNALWGGDVFHPLSFGTFAGTGGGVVPAIVVLAVAVVGLTQSGLSGRLRLALGVVLAALLLLDLRFRLVSTGAYMDFKHLSYVGAIVLVLAVAGVWRLAVGRQGALRALAVVLAVAWTGAALWQDHLEARVSGPQVTPEMMQIRQWARALPPGASVRVDIPASGVQLWAVYMLGDHPVDAPYPVLYTTYAHAPYGLRADYSLSLVRYPSTVASAARPYPTPLGAVNPPLARNATFALRRIEWPRRLAGYPKTASTALVEP